MITYPKFSKGNKFFIKALNDVVSFARRHGVNPASRRGWSETADGWVPPDFSGAGGGGPVRWDLVVVPDSQPAKYTVLLPAVTLESAVAITNVEFVPAVAKWLVAEIVNRTNPAIVLKLIDQPDAVYQFTGTTFVAARLPIWKFSAAESAESVVFPDDVFGVKQVRGEVLQMFFRLYQIPTTTTIRSVPAVF
jgi:hypothetical protein